MTKVKPEDRKHTKVTRSRMGFRKVKCDEAKPACVRCKDRSFGTSTGRKCDGYALQPQPRPSEHQAGRHFAQPDELTAVRIATTLGSGQETRHLQFFVEKTLLQLQTFFPDELWSKYVLQMAYSDDCIRHGLVALASHHEFYVSHEDSNNSSFALREYNLAIKSITGTAGLQKPPHIHLLSCLLFMCIEILQGKYPSAVYLFRCGYGIIRSSRQGRGALEQATATAQNGTAKTEFQIITRLIETYFHRYAVQILMLLGDVAPEIPPSLITGFLQTDQPQNNRPFRSLSDARESLLELALGGFDAPAMNETEHAAYNDRLDQWSLKFEELLATRRRFSPLNATEERTVALLRLHMHNAYVNLKCCPPGTYGADMMMWDQFTSVFVKMLEYAVIAAGLDTNGDSEPQPVFHTELGIVSAVISIAGKCRDPLIRRSAIALLLADTFQEGIWSSVLAARVARRIVIMEEAGRDVHSPADVPQEARLRRLRVRISPESRRAEILYGFLHTTYEEVLEWQ